MHRAVSVTLLSALVTCAAAVGAQTKYPSKFSPQIAETREVKEALAYLDEKFADQVAEWITITEIPAKSTFEQKRGEYVKGEFQKLGLEVSVDEIGNVIGRRKGATGSWRIWSRRMRHR